ncbi:sodium-dependent glucose transporter 1-like protein [Leptotrombidium deliense]|uniref:Major facilitator superfamily domain-containing protein 4A n=1 Tax=Leptotrombidium deliense TaxID=299467 RepID=A0A443S426_9ACAR|nr:sodium-dependent glucose transporter 1-like protein [Leptotrombidium deliense]
MNRKKLTKTSPTKKTIKISSSVPIDVYANANITINLYSCDKNIFKSHEVHERDKHERDRMYELSKTWKLIATGLLILCNFCYMLLISSFRSTLIDFKETTNTTLFMMSFSFTFRYVGCCTGAALTYALPAKLNLTVVHSFMLTILGILAIIIGQLTKLWSIFLVNFLMGLTSGAHDVLSPAQIFQLWGDKGAPFMQATVFTWNIASVCSPLIFVPFLSSTRTHEEPTNHMKTANFTYSQNEIESFRESRIWIPLSIVGSMLVMMGIMLLLTPIYAYFKSENEARNGRNGECELNAETELSSNTARKSNWEWYKVYILALCSILVATYFLIQSTVLNFWFPFVVNCDLQFSKTEAAFMSSVLYVSFAVSSFSGIFISKKVQPIRVILSLFSMIAVANIIHLFFASSSLVMLWIGALLEFSGFGCFYTSLLNYVQLKVGLTRKMCSALVVFRYLFAAVGYDALIGNYIETMPLVLVYNNIACLTFFSFVLIAIRKLNTINTRINQEHEIKLKDQSINLTNVHDS